MDLKPSKLKFRLPSRYFDSVCRVCLSDSKLLVPLKDVYLTHCFAAKGKIENISLIDMIYRFSRVLVTSSDGKPQQICESCINMSIQTFNFLQSFVSSDNFLNEKLPQDKKPVTSIFSSDVQLANTLIKIECQDDESLSEDIRFEIVESSNADETETDKSEEEKRVSDDEMDDGKPKVSFVELMEQLDVKFTAVSPVKRGVASSTTYKGDTFNCKMCGFHCTGIQPMIEHANEKHVDSNYRFNQCVLCKKQFRECQYNYHLATHCRKALVCKFCFLYFETQEEFDEHNNIIDHKNFTCKLCNKKFVETKGKKGKLISLRMRLHIRYAHKQEGKSECDICGKQFKYAANVRRHYRSSHSQVKFLCQSCPRAFTSNYQLKYHIDQSHPEDVGADLKIKYPHRYKKDLTNNTMVIQCEFCNARFKTTHGFYVHCETHPSFTEYGCQICETEFPSLEQLLDHQQEHTQYSCTYCDQKFVLRCDLISHKVKHRDRKVQIEDTQSKNRVRLHRKSGPLVIKCGYCPKVVRSYFGLYGHSWIHPEFKEYNCMNCDAVLDNMNSFREHYKEQHSELMCELCQKIFPNRRSYLCHRSNKHRDQIVKSNKTCEICGVAFVNIGKRQMDEHMYTHTGERPYMCEICGKGFKQEAHLSIHRFQHGELQMKPWKCKLCPKSFVFPSALKCHIRTHTGEKPYTCLFCPKTYRDQTSRHKHINKYHPTRVPEYKIYRQKHLKDEMKRVETDLETTLYECDKELWNKQRFQGMGRTMRKKQSPKPVELAEEVDEASVKDENDAEESSGEIEFVDINEDHQDESDDEYILLEMDDDSGDSEEGDDGDETIVEQEESEMAEDEEIEFIEEDDSPSS